MKKLTGLSDTKRKLTYLTCCLAIAVPFAAVADVASKQLAKNKPFSSMAITPDDPNECRVPRPPTELAPTAYVRNGYRAILRIMAAEQWKKTGSCECFLTQIPWDNVVLNSEKFKTSDDDRRPFSVAKLRTRADELLAERDKVCAE